MMMTTFEKGVAQGILLGQRQVLRQQLENKFGSLSPLASQRLEAWPAERISELIASVLKADSLKELGLED